MPDQETNLHTAPIELHERRIAMPDGRYMVFFTFADDAGRDLSEDVHPSSTNGSSHTKTDV